jgi:adenylyltransferase/sulfurtransferase
MTRDRKKQQAPAPPEDGGRDSRLRLIDWFDVAAVRAARVLLVGTGAIGNETLKNLALLGVGHLYVFDRDKVEMSNLSRSVLFSEADLDQHKALVAARAARRLSPAVDARWKAGDVLFDLGLGVLRRMDVIVAGLDNVRARLRLNEMCLRAGRPWIEAGIGVLDAHVSVYRPDSPACYECYTPPELKEFGLPCKRLASRYESEGRVPTTPTTASIVGGVQAQEALKLLHPRHWRGRSLASRQFVFNGTSAEALVVGLTRNPDCDQHFTPRPESFAEVREFSAAKTTVGELFEGAAELLGSEVTLELNFVLALRLKCECRKPRPILQPLEKLYMEDLRCRKCNFQPLHAEALDPVSSINRQLLESRPELRRAKLARIGVPPLDVIRAKGSRLRRTRKGRDGRPDSWRHVPTDVYVELTGDLRDDFHFHEA